MSNYPAGAADDPEAPWNEPMEVDVDVTVRQTLVKETVVRHDADDDGDVMALFRCQQRTPLEVMECCYKIAAQLMREGRRWTAGIDLATLKADCADWFEEELTGCLIEKNRQDGRNEYD